MGPVTTYCCGTNNRGVPVYGDKVYLATLDAKLLAFEAKTGSLVADPGRRSQARLQRDDGAHRGELIGTSGGEYGLRGFVRAYDEDREARLVLRYDARDGVWA